jgi:phenylacetic acid degradation operon negative regulatory protein
MELETKILILLADRKELNSTVIKKILKISLDEKKRLVDKTIKKLKQAKAIKENGQLFKITGNGLKRLPRAKEQLSYQLPYWLGNWAMLIFDIPESQKKKRDQLRYRLKKYGFGMIQSSIWVVPRAIPSEIVGFVEKAGLSQQTNVFNFSIKKEDLDRLIEQAWQINSLDQRYNNFVEEAKKRFRLVKEYSWKSDRIRNRALKLLAEHFQERYHSLRKLDPELPRSVLSSDWQGFRAFHIYQQLEKYL